MYRLVTTSFRLITLFSRPGPKVTVPHVVGDLERHEVLNEGDAGLVTKGRGN